MSLRRSYTAVVERNAQWIDTFATEPYEAGWASEAIFFVRALDIKDAHTERARVQISPDGMHWVDEGTTMTLPTKANDVVFCKVSHFGGWLRLAGDLNANQQITVIVYLVLKE